jgi:probable O-glycosylation ligase (exosortase A-associated)
MLRLIFVAVILVIGGIGALRSRFRALLLYIWFALFRPQEWVWIDITAYRLSTLLGVLLIVPCVLTGVWPVIAHPISIGALGFLATCYGGQFNAVNADAGWYWLDFMSKLILITLLGIRLTSTPARLFTLIAVMAGSFGFNAGKAGLFSIMEGGTRYFEGTGGAFLDNNAYAVGCVMILPFLAVVAQNAPKRWMRWLGVAGAIGTAATVVATFSRGGLLALSAATAVYVLLQRRNRLLVFGAVTAMAVLLLIALPSGYLNRMSTIGTYEEVGDASALGRLHFWRTALKISADYPTGIGLWNFADRYDEYDSSGGQYGPKRAVHNSHLQVLTETGWAGALFWVFLFVVAFRICLRVRRQAHEQTTPEAHLYLTVANATLASMVGFLVGGMFVSMALNDLTWLTFGLVASLDRVSRQPVTAQEPVFSATAVA